MTDKTKKTLILNTLILCFCVCIIALFCFIPNKQLEPKENIDTYIIRFDSTGGSSVKTIEVASNDEIPIPEPPVREGYIFIGWMYNGELYDFSQGLTSDITLTAAWKEIDTTKTYYTITFNTDGGSTIANQIIEEGDIVIKPGDPTKEGYEFIEWHTEAGEAYNFYTPVTNDLTLLAIYKENPIDTPPADNTKRYTVTFNCNGGTGSGCGSRTVKEGDKVSSFTPTRAHFTFNGWDYDFNTPITKNTTITAKWIEDSKFSVQFYANGGNGTCSVRTEYSGTVLNTSASLCSSVSRAHYNLLGWNTNASAKTNQGNISITGNTNLYAIWQEKTYSHTITPIGDALSTFYAKITINGAESAIEQIELTFEDNGTLIVGSDGEFLNAGNPKTCKVTFKDTPGKQFNC